MRFNADVPLEAIIIRDKAIAASTFIRGVYREIDGAFVAKF